MLHDLGQHSHRLWNRDHPAACVAKSESVFEFELQEATGGQFTSRSTASDINSFDWDRVYPLNGPVYIEDAKPGDTLKIEFMEMKPVNWGWTAILPGLGLLSDQFPEAYLHIWDLSNSRTADFLGIATIPIRPFCGVVGVCPDIREPASVMAPGPFGGNVDCRDLTEGSSLYLPVQVPGGLLSFGDPHAAQGDGELCVSAIEASMTGAARVSLIKDRPISGPQFETPGPLRPHLEDLGYFATMGVAPDLMQAARSASMAMIDHLVRNYKMSPEDAYIFCSVAVDLRITEVVDAPNWIVSAYLPLAVFY